MFFKLLVVLVMVGIISAMFIAGKNILAGETRGNSALLSLKWRIGLSVSLFLVLFVAFSMGLIQPHGL